MNNYLLKLLENKNKLLFLLSLIMLSALLVVYSDLYLFTLNKPGDERVFPSWIEKLPEPLGRGFPGFTRVAIFFCLIPIIFISDKFSKCCLLLIQTVALSIIPVIALRAIPVIALRTIHDITIYIEFINKDLVLPVVIHNVLSECVWIIVFQSLIPTLFVLFLLYLKALVQRNYK